MCLSRFLPRACDVAQVQPIEAALPDGVKLVVMIVAVRTQCDCEKCRAVRGEPATADIPEEMIHPRGGGPL